ncbi:galactoside alpha-(1,2)-fucosyltransferase 1-like [Liolophura sinensis]|uniref:galactoside alpha-(1,2)-fucosyltransferase 1-like n=1 Tax=Liolophura sinensis TaxID=3198878 RepID=UPI0031596F5C
MAVSLTHSESNNQTDKAFKANTLYKKNKPQANLCFLYNARLGNRMFQYAAVLGIATEKNMVPVIQKDHPELQTFELGAKLIDDRECLRYLVHRGKRYAAFDNESVAFDSRVNTILSGSYQSWRYFRHVEQELRHHFAFRQHILDEARSTLSDAVRQQGFDKFPEQTLVGIHVRRGDMLMEEYVNTGYKTAPQDYFLRAMDIFLRKFPVVVFIVCSEDQEWVRSFIPHDRAVFISPRSAEKDLAVLSLCNHMIMSVGSFGWWAGWLAGGMTIYYKHQTAERSLLSKGFVLSDYMPPEWIGLD